MLETFVTSRRHITTYIVAVDSHRCKVFLIQLKLHIAGNMFDKYIPSKSDKHNIN